MLRGSGLPGGQTHSPAPDDTWRAVRTCGSGDDDDVDDDDDDDSSCCCCSSDSIRCCRRPSSAWAASCDSTSSRRRCMELFSSQVSVQRTRLSADRSSARAQPRRHIRSGAASDLAGQQTTPARFIAARSLTAAPSVSILVFIGTHTHAETVPFGTGWWQFRFSFPFSFWLFFRDPIRPRSDPVHCCGCLCPFWGSLFDGDAGADHGRWSTLVGGRPSAAANGRAGANHVHIQGTPQWAVYWGRWPTHRLHLGAGPTAGPAPAPAATAVATTALPAPSWS